MLRDLIDEYYTARERRLALSREHEAADKIEKELKRRILDTLRAENLTAAGGSLAVVKLQKKIKPVAKDWSQLYGYIKLQGGVEGFDLLQRRLTETACELRWTDGILIPGVEQFPVFDFTVSKPNV